MPGAPPYVQQAVFEYQFDALLIATGGGLLKTLAPMLPYFDIDTQKDVKPIGSGNWDYASIGQEEALLGGWYASPDPSGG